MGSLSSSAGGFNPPLPGGQATRVPERWQPAAHTNTAQGWRPTLRPQLAQYKSTLSRCSFILSRGSFSALAFTFILVRSLARPQLSPTRLRR